MTIHDQEPSKTNNERPEIQTSQQGCEKLPSMKARAANLEAFIEKAGAEIERIEGELRTLRAQPGSPERDRKLTPLGKKLEEWYNGRYTKSQELSQLIDDIRDLEGRCIRRA